MYSTTGFKVLLNLKVFQPPRQPPHQPSSNNQRRNQRSLESYIGFEPADNSKWEILLPRRCCRRLQKTLPQQQVGKYSRKNARRKKFPVRKLLSFDGLSARASWPCRLALLELQMQGSANDGKATGSLRNHSSVAPYQRHFCASASGVRES